MSSAFYPLGMNLYNNRTNQGGYNSSKGVGVFSNPTGVTAGNIRPLTNNDPTNSTPQKFGLPRPIKHYRKGISVALLEDSTNSRQVKSSSQGNLIGQMIDIPGGYIVKENTAAEISNTEELDRDCHTCQGIGIISDWQPITDLTEKPEPKTQTQQYCCNQERNALKRMRSANTKLKKNYYTSTTNYLYNRCQTFDQKQFNYISLGNAATKPGAPLSQDNTYKANCNPNLEIQFTESQLPDANTLTPSNPLGCETVQYKPNNYKYGQQGAVSSSDRMLRLNVETIDTNRANIIKSQENLTKSKYFQNASGTVNNSCCIIGSKAVASFGTTILYITYPTVTRNFTSLTPRFSFPSSFSSISDPPVPVIQNEYILVVPSYELIDSNKVKMTLKYQLFTNNDAELLTVGLSFANNVNYYNQNTSIIEIIQFDKMPLYGLGNQFSGLTPEILISAPDQPRIINGTFALNCFKDCTNFNSPGIINWNIKNVVNLQGMFANTPLFNQPVGSWDTSNVTNMSYMFYFASAFNQDISVWDTSAVEDMSFMFEEATAFNNGEPGIQDLSGNFASATFISSTSTLTCPGAAFTTELSLNDGIVISTSAGVLHSSQIEDISSNTVLILLTPYGGNLTAGGITSIQRIPTSVGGTVPLPWNTGNVTNMKKMFQNALSFNQYIGDWTTTNVLNMGSMFVFASSFNNGQVSGLSNASLNSWNTGNVTLMNNMFQNASAFNQLIGDWDTHSATNMEFMFSVTQFNQPLTTNGNKWNTGNVTSMRYMFNETSAFNQDVSSWDTSSVENFSYMFYKSLAFNNGDSGNNGLKPLTWNTTSATTLRTMFYASPFNQNVNSWNTSLVTDMTNTFALATKFNNGQAAGLSDASLNWNAPLCTSFVSMFNTCVAFNQNVSNLVDTSGLISSSGCNLSSMFQSAILFNNGDLSNNYSKPLTWDTKNVTIMTSTFKSASSFNQYIGNWDTSRVTDMTFMFQTARLFNNGETGTADISGNVATAYYTTSGSVLTCPDSAIISGLAVNNVIIITTGPITSPTIVYTSKIATIPTSTTLTLSTNYGSNIGTVGAPIITSIKKQVVGTRDMSWNTTSLPDMQYMFSDATYFNQRVDKFTVGNATQMFSSTSSATPNPLRGIFNNGQLAGSNDNSLRYWNTVASGSTGAMFLNSSGFNQNVSNWNVSNVGYMGQMFQGTRVYNNGLAPGFFNNDSSLNSWVTTSLTDFQVMFNGAISFNQNISNWDVSKVTTMNGTFSGATLFNNGDTSGNFNQPLTSWYAPKCVDFTRMFSSAPAFNQNISNLVNTSDVSACDLTQMFSSASTFNNGQTGTMDISGNLNTSSAFYTNSSRLLTCTGGNFTKLTSADVLIITTGSIASPTILYTSQIQTTPISDVSLVLLTAYGADILSGITSIKKQVAGTADLSWNTANVTTINGIFSRAPYFNQRLPWDVSNVTDMTLAFNGVTPALKSTFNNGQLAGSSTQPLTNASLVPWSPTKCRSFNSMFISTLGFNQPMLNFVDTSGITLDAFGNGVNLTSMFSSATVFNQNLNTWNVDNVTNMNNMFQTAVAYNNGSLTNDGANELLWSAPNCPNFTSMFQSATAFNQKVNNLVNTTNVIDCSLNSMFQAATLFNNGQTGTMDISGNPFIGASYTDATRLLTSLNSKFLTDLSSNDVLIITGTGFIYTSQIQPPIVSDVSLVLLTAYGANIGTGTITSVKKQVAGSAVLSWNTINVKNMSALFSGAYYFNQQLPWNVSNVTNMSSMFAVGTTALRDLFNNGQLAGSSSQPLNWTATKCTNFNSMFAYTSGFNQPITTLVDTSGVAGCSLTSMFQNTTVFNQNVGAWNVSRVTAMNIMFANTTVFNNGGPLNDTSNNLTWYAPNCINFTSMFQSAPAFNQSMPTLVDTSGITVGTAVVLTSMLLSATTFNQNISTWNTNNVTLMDNMFSGALAFNNGQLKPSDISGTITSGSYTNSTATLNVPLATFTTDLSVNNVLTIATGTITTPIIIYTSQIQRIISNTSLVLVTPYGSNILTGITSIKKQVIGDTSLNNWNTSNVTTMVNMFQNAYYFNQNISNWSTSKVTTMSSMFAGPSTLLKTTFNNGQLVGSSDASLNWTAPRCTTFASMFLNTSGFNQAMPYLVDVSCTTFINMFQNASVFNQNVSSWNTSSVTTMASVFQSARVFNNGQSVTQTVRGTPSLASYVNTTPFILTCPDASFNLDFSLNDGIIITMGGSAIYSSIVATIPTNATLTLSDTYPLGLNLAAGAITSIKKQVVGSAALLWNTQSVTNITSIFNGATYFNQQLPWNTRKVTNVTTVFIGSAAFINLFNNGQITGGASQRLYPGSGNTWDFSNNTITGGTSGAWCANSRLVVGVTGNGVTINPALT